MGDTLFLLPQVPTWLSTALLPENKTIWRKTKQREVRTGREVKSQRESHRNVNNLCMCAADCVRSRVCTWTSQPRISFCCCYHCVICVSVTWNSKAMFKLGLCLKLGSWSRPWDKMWVQVVYLAGDPQKVSRQNEKVRCEREGRGSKEALWSRAPLEHLWESL